MNPIIEFQKKVGLVSDGIIGEKTLAKMREVFRLNKMQLAHFLGQISHESSNFKAKRENLNYSAQALRRVFGKYFNSYQASEYERKPFAIANRVYANRMGNGNEESGDGWKFRGNGAPQLTGKDNHYLFAKYVNNFEIMKNPDIIWQYYYFESALWFFNENRLWRYTNSLEDSEIMKLSKAINVGNAYSRVKPHGFESRKKRTLHYYNLQK